MVGLAKKFCLIILSVQEYFFFEIISHHFNWRVLSVYSHVFQTKKLVLNLWAKRNFFLICLTIWKID